MLCSVYRLYLVYGDEVRRVCDIFLVFVFDLSCWKMLKFLEKDFDFELLVLFVGGG